MFETQILYDILNKPQNIQNKPQDIQKIITELLFFFL